MTESARSVARSLGVDGLRAKLYVWYRYFQTRLPGRRQLWASQAEFDENWKVRIARMASYIDQPGPVVDFGCGPMWLEAFLRPDNTYVPVDYIRRDARTIVVDLNANALPALNASTAVLSGVIEYVRDLDRLVHQLEQQPFRRVIVSYNTLERVPWMRLRQAFNWTSHAHLDELLVLFCRHFNLVAIEGVETNTVLVFDRKTD